MGEKASFLRSFFVVFVIFFMQELFENALHLFANFASAFQCSWIGQELIFVGFLCRNQSVGQSVSFFNCMIYLIKITTLIYINIYLYK